MKKLRWQFVIILLTGIVVGILLVTQQPAGNSTEGFEPTAGGVYTEGLTGSINRLNPLLDANNTIDQDIDSLIYSGLVRFDSRGNPQPDLAETWGISEDGTTYNFAIRSNAKWQDGKPVTAEDVVFTIDQMRDDNSPVSEDLRAFWKEIEVTAQADKVLQFRLPEAYAPFLDYLSFGVLPKHLLANVKPALMEDASFNLTPIGSGPFKFDHFLADGDQITGVVLTANENYYIRKPYLEQIVFKVYADSAAVLNAYQQGEIQGIGEVTTDILSQVLAEPELSVYSGRKPELSLVLFNLNDDQLPFFKDSDIRRALLLGLNRQWMVDHLMGGQAMIADGPIFPGTWAYYDGTDRVTYDPDAAAEILKNAGYVLSDESATVRQNESTKLSFTLLCSDDPTDLEIADTIASNWAKIGVEVTIQSMTYEELIQDHLEERDYQAALVNMNFNNSPDPDPYPFWDEAEVTNGQNYSQWDDRNASEYLERARISVDNAERTKMYGNFQVIFAEELPALPLFYPVYNYAVSTEVQGVQMGPLIKTSDRFLTITDWFLTALSGSQTENTATSAASP